MVVRQDIDNTSAIITVTLPRDEYKPKFEAELKRYRQKAPIKGFRLGHAPMEHVKRMFGSALYSELIQDMIAEKLIAYLNDNRVDILGQPLPVEDQPSLKLNYKEMQEEYTVAYEIGYVPKFELKGIDKSYTYERPVVNNLEELAEQDLNYIVKRRNERVEAEDDIQQNDLVTINAYEMDGDQPKEDGWAMSVKVLIEVMGNEQLKTQLLSMKKGDTLRLNPRHLEEHEDEEMYRKYILHIPADDQREVGDDFEGTIVSVSRVIESEPTTEFFRQNFGKETKEESIEQLKERVSGYYMARSNALLFNNIKQRLLELNPVELPVKFLRRWNLVNDPSPVSEEEWEKSLPNLLDSLRWNFILGDIVDEFGIKATDQEVREELVDRVREYFWGEDIGSLPDHIFKPFVDKMMKESERVATVRREIENIKVFETLQKHVTIQDIPTHSDQIHAAMDELRKNRDGEVTEETDLVEGTTDAL